ncbi:MAG: DNA primase [Phenylobacterium sp.]|uniref:DNA primase n=1 Tax=Phenylobacterium sp. TaxID=1871053 RepID=UPI0027158EB6|nr:DNA primase [Phenylobacterium sp.]MDO8902540.1 DNA primase [Phenylobacterium sp.]MDP2214998.1 DNA primase [Phenylobacterium sp.]
MKFDERFLDEIKARLRPSDVIGRTVKLRKQGREFVGLSPFTKERSPSFFVNDDKGQFFDFSSGKTGDLITFLQETERLTFVEAVERLAAEAGVPMPAPDPQSAERDRVRQGLAEWLEQAGAWFQAELRRPVGREARDYLAARGLPEAEWARFGIGYAPGGRTALKDYLVAKGARPGELVEAGLLIAPEDGGAPYDRFRDRIMFPIADGRGRFVSFGGRAMDPKARAKYLNGPETSVFHKGHVLYGMGEARKILGAAPSGENPSLVVVEGYMDAIACHRAGVAAVAPMGTALTEEQMEMLWRLHPEPTLCFDGDRAGRQAAFRAMDRALPILKPGKSFQFSLVEGGKDPDDVLREQGPVALRQQLATTTPFAQALFERERDLEPLDTPERRAGLKGRLRQAAASIADSDLQQAYRQDLLERYDGLFRKADSAPGQRPPWRPAGPRQGRWKGRDNAWEQAQPPTARGKAAAGQLARGLEPAAAALAAFALARPAVLEDHLEDAFATDGFGEPALCELVKEIIRLRLESDHLDSDSLTRHLALCGFNALLTDIDRAAAKSGAPFLKPDVSLEAANSQWSQAFARLSRLASLDKALDASKGNLRGRSDMEAFERLKGERDALRRATREWND